MNDKNKQLLNEVIKNRLERALKSEANVEDNIAFRQAMEAVDRQIKLSELEANRLLEVSKFEAACAEQNYKQEKMDSEAKWDKVFKVVEIVAVPVVMAGVQYWCNMRYAKTLCNFEKDYTFTTSAGRATSKFFNFRNKN